VGSSPTPADPEHPDGPIALRSDEATIVNLMHYSDIMKFRVRRGEQTVELVITPRYPTGTTKGTPTPVPPNDHYY